MLAPLSGRMSALLLLSLPRCRCCLPLIVFFGGRVLARGELDTAKLLCRVQRSIDNSAGYECRN